MGDDDQIGLKWQKKEGCPQDEPYFEIQRKTLNITPRWLKPDWKKTRQYEWLKKKGTAYVMVGALPRRGKNRKKKKGTNATGNNATNSQGSGSSSNYSSEWKQRLGLNFHAVESTVPIMTISSSDLSDMPPLLLLRPQDFLSAESEVVDMIKTISRCATVTTGRPPVEFRRISNGDMGTPVVACYLMTDEVKTISATHATDMKVIAAYDPSATEMDADCERSFQPFTANDGACQRSIQVFAKLLSATDKAQLLKIVFASKTALHVQESNDFDHLPPHLLVW